MELANTAGTVNVAGIVFTLIAGLALLFLPRRYAMVPILVLVCFMTMGQALIIVGLNFTMIRVLLVFGWLRLLLRGEARDLKWNGLDTLIIAWVVIRTMNYTIVHSDWNAFINRLGYAYNIAGAYFLFRYLVRTPEEVWRSVKLLAMFVIPVAGLMISEKLAARNVFSVFGGVPLVPEMRDGVYRCQGPFAHSILAGTFGATSLPLFVGMWYYRRRSRILGVLAAVAATAIVFTTGSSGPVLAYLFGWLALLLWRQRHHVRLLRWALVLLLIVLQFVMNSPVWFLAGRLTVFSGSTGWYRGYLIDMAVHHIGEWWLIGTRDAPNWHYFLIDVTNQYIAEGFDGGLISTALLIAILVVSFRRVGKSAWARSAPRPLQRLEWALGGGLLAHAVSFISVSYFDQNFITLYFLLVAIGVLQAVPVHAVEGATSDTSTTGAPQLHASPSMSGGY
jgi:hypothetical protein